MLLTVAVTKERGSAEGEASRKFFDATEPVTPVKGTAPTNCMVSV
jgi:hypothetical protein